MALGLVSHLYARVAASFVGFFGGAAVFALFFFDGTHSSMLPFWFFGLIGGGTYLAQLALGLAVPAVCPACSAASAVPTLRKPLLYGCRTCGVATDATSAMLTSMMGGLESAETQRGGTLLAWLFVFAGLGSFAVGMAMSQDAIGLLRDGTSTEGKVVAVTQKPWLDNRGGTGTLNSKAKPATLYTAVIQYHVDEVAHTFTRSWSVPDSGGCMFPCYHPGEALKVIYVPGEPLRAKVHSITELFGAAGMFSLGGLLFALIGILLIRYQSRLLPPRRESWKEMRDLFAELKPPAQNQARPRAGPAAPASSSASRKE